MVQLHGLVSSTQLEVHIEMIRLPNPWSWDLGSSGKGTPASIYNSQDNHQHNYSTCWKTCFNVLINWHPIIHETQVHVLD